MLLAPAYAIKVQLFVELNGDGTRGFVQEFVNLLAFVVPDCRGSFHVWGTGLTPDKCKSEQFFTQFYILLLKGFNHLFKDFTPRCAVSASFQKLRNYYVAALLLPHVVVT